MTKIKGYKGFDKNLQCRRYQYKENADFKEEGNIRCCENGFHFCENPMDVFGYYPPSDSRYCEVEGSGQVDKNGGDDSKIAVSKLHVGVEVGLKGIIEAGVKFIFDKVDWKNDKESNGEECSTATNTGYQSAATNTGYQSAATVKGKESVAIATGYESKARGSLGCWIVVTEWYQDEEGDHHINDIKSARVDGQI